jgi:hypothetical protein
MALPQQLSGIGVLVFPTPMLGLVDLLGRIDVALQTGPGYLGTGFEFDLELFEFSMIGGRGLVCRVSYGASGYKD